MAVGQYNITTYIPSVDGMVPTYQCREWCVAQHLSVELGSVPLISTSLIFIVLAFIFTEMYIRNPENKWYIKAASGSLIAAAACLVAFVWIEFLK